MTDVSVMQTNVQADTFLQHFGVKGMKWGKHTGGDSGGSVGPSRAQERVNKAQAKVAKVVAKQKEEAARDKTILDARKNIEKTGNQLQVAKAQYKVDKHTLGKTKAKEALSKVKDKHMSNVYNSQLSTAKELTDARKKEFWDAVDTGFKNLEDRANAA
jgi:hypothetical protein